MATFTTSALVPAADPRTAAAARYRSAVGDIAEVLELVADVCRAPMVALKVADSSAAHFAATLGMRAPRDVPKSASLCDIVSADDSTVVVDDAPRDPRVAAHPLVAGAESVKFLAAAPLHYDRHVVGALCVFDPDPRDIDGATTRRMLARIAQRIDRETALRDRLTQQHILQSCVDHEEMITAISHEIRTPLAAIQGHLELMSDALGDGRFDRNLATIGRNAARLTRTVDNFLHALDHERHAPSGEREVVDLAGVVENVLGRLGPAAERVQRDTYSAYVIADGDLLETAVEHLLVNALGYSAVDTPVTVRVTDYPYPMIEVYDRGPGLDAAEMGMIGTAFFRGDHARVNQMPGLGLGLAVSRRIIEAQGGLLHLHSAVGDGTIAQISFPPNP